MVDQTTTALIFLGTGILAGFIFGFIVVRSFVDKKRRGRAWLHVYSTGSMGYLPIPIKRGVESVEMEIEGRPCRIVLDGSCRFNDKVNGEVVYPVNAKTGKVFRPPENEAETGLDLDGFKLAVLLEGGDIRSMSGGLGDLRALMKYAIIGIAILGVIVIGGMVVLGNMGG